MDKKFIKYLESWKKHECIFFFQNVQKVQKRFGILEKTTVKFSPKSDQNPPKNGEKVGRRATYIAM